MRVKALLILCVLFAALSANAAFAGVEELTDLELRVTQIRRGFGQLRETIPNTRVTVVFGEEGKVSGSTGCNRYFASYSVSGNEIKVGPAASTRKYCARPSGVMEQEADFLNALESAEYLYFDDAGFVVLQDAAGEILLVMADANSEIFDAKLAGLWFVESMAGKALLPGTKVTMGFTEDGRVAGKATVNNYFASWIESDGQILFSHAGSTMMAGPEAHMRQESEFFNLLGRVRRYKVLGDQLILTTAEGEEITAVKATE